MFIKERKDSLYESQRVVDVFVVLRLSSPMLKLNILEMLLLRMSFASHYSEY